METSMKEVEMGGKKMRHRINRYVLLAIVMAMGLGACNPEVTVDGDDIADTAAELCKRALETNIVLCAACSDPDEFPGIKCTTEAQAHACGWDVLDENQDGKVTITLGGETK